MTTRPMPSQQEPAAAATPPAAPECLLASARCAGRPRQDDVEARTRHLIAVAGDLFLAHGYGKVSLEAIARDAHVAVRTIYVKFGGKAGLFNAVIAGARDQFFAGLTELDTDTRPLEAVLADFGVRFLNLMTMPGAIRIQRIVAAEADSNPELAQTFFKAGPALTREILTRYFMRPEIRPLFREAVPVEMLAIHLTNCLLGDPVSRLIADTEQAIGAGQIEVKVRLGLDLFLHGTLKRPAA